jgi:hypothetical protein
MKAEHRKELQTNTLAHSLEQTLQGLKEGPSRNTVLILVLVGLAVVLVFTWRYFSHSALEADSARWYRWDNLVAPEQVDAFIKDKDTEGSEPALLARFLEARRTLQEGLRDLGQFTMREKAVDNVKKARDVYSKLVSDTASKPLLNQEALLCSAQANEALGDYDAAKSLYSQLADKFKDTVHGKNAAKQVERLNNDANKDDLRDLRSRLVESPSGLP